MTGRPRVGRPIAYRRRGYTIVELFLTVAVLMVLLGGIINLDNRLRSDSLERRTRSQLRALTAAVDRYAAAHGGLPPAVTPLVDPAGPPPAPLAVTGDDPPALTAAAAANAADVRRALHLPAGDEADDPLRDPWGTPLAFLPRQSPAIGMAPGDRSFFVSAGPDRRFLARADNLYSFDYADAPPPAP